MGWLGFVLIGGGALSVWAGFQGIPLTEVVSSVLGGRPVPGTSATVRPANPDPTDTEAPPTGGGGRMQVK